MEIKAIDQHTWLFDEGGVRFFLLEGEKEALLIDSGMMTKNAKELAEEKTSLPVKLLNTHADRDHLGSIEEFSEFYMNPAEAVNFYNGNAAAGTMIPVEDKDTLDLGGRVLQIIALPGHTPGSIAVLDRNTGALFSGDPIQDGNIFMFGAMRELHAYAASLEKLYAMKDSFKTIYPSHGSVTVPKEIIPQLIDGAKKIMAGEDEGKEVDMFGNKVILHHMGFAGFLCEK